MKTRKKLSDPNAEKIIQLLEFGAGIQLFSSNWTPFRFEDFMGNYNVKTRQYNKKNK